MTPTDEPASWDERATLLTMLQYTRDTAAHRCRDLDDVAAASAPLRTSPLMTIAGVINHMRWVEHSWVENRFLDGPDLGPWTDASPDQDFIDGTGAPLATILQEYAAQAQRTDAIIVRHDLDDLSALALVPGPARPCDGF